MGKRTRTTITKGSGTGKATRFKPGNAAAKRVVPPALAIAREEDRSRMGETAADRTIYLGGKEHKVFATRLELCFWVIEQGACGHPKVTRRMVEAADRMIAWFLPKPKHADEAPAATVVNNLHNPNITLNVDQRYIEAARQFSDSIIGVAKKPATPQS